MTLLEQLGGLQHRALLGLVRRATRLRRATLTPRGAYRAEGLALPALVRSGEGPPVVFVHGFGADKESWLSLAAQIERTRPLVLLDLPGFGEAPHVSRERASAKAQASAVVAALSGLPDVHGFGETHARSAHFVGSSMGGGISQRVAADFPDRAASLALIGSVGPLLERSDALSLIEAGDNPLVVRSTDAVHRMMDLVMERRPPMTRAMVAYVARERMLRADPLHALFEGWASTMMGSDGIPSDLSTIRAPTLVIHGERDRVLPASTGRALAAGIPGARLELLRGVGHVPSFEAPRHVARALEAHWARTETRPS